MLYAIAMGQIMMHVTLQLEPRAAMIFVTKTERQTDKERQTDRQTDKDRERDRPGPCS